MKKQNLDDFIQKIERVVANSGTDYIDAIVHLCEEEDIEIEVAAKLISSNQRLKALVQGDAESLNFLPKRSKLPV